MKTLYLAIACATAAALIQPVSAAQADWKIVKDKTGVCQISVPSNWNTGPGFANLDSASLMIISGRVPYKPFRADTLKVLGVTKVYENSATRSLYASPPGGTPPRITYHVQVPGKINDCIAEISLSVHASEEDAKSIAATLTQVK